MSQTKSKRRTTESVLAEMLAENTGTHFLDSGGVRDANGNVTQGYGRNWERNQGRNFAAEPSGTVEFCYYPARPEHKMEPSVGIEYTKNLYYFLRENLDFDAKMNDKFVRFANRKENKDMYWLECMEAFWEYLREKGYKVRGLYGDGEPFTENSYNHECNLSQTIQFGYAEIEEDGGLSETYIFLQVHGGCDVRGGYTDVKVFTSTNDSGILSFADGYIGCEKGHSWYTDDNSHWYVNSYPVPTYTLETMFGTETIEVEVKNLHEYTAEELQLDTDKEYSNQPGYCPVCAALPGHEKNQILA